MMIYKVIIAGLALIVIYLAVRLLNIRSNIKRIIVDLTHTRDEGYNRQLRITLSDSNIEKLAKEINSNLDYQTRLKLEEEKARSELEQSISDISHDLRTPLTVVKGNLQLLEKQELSPKAREYVQISSKKAEALKNMVDEFFELAVLESDADSPKLKRLDMVRWLSEFIIENEVIIRDRELEPEIHFPERSLYVMADPDMLNRVFGNLLTNILKYAYKSFLLTVSEMDGKCIIRIGNTVKSPEEIDTDKIFDRTYRADKARKTGSAGLGLYIAKLLVEKQNGMISAEITDDRLIFTIEFIYAN